MILAEPGGGQRGRGLVVAAALLGGAGVLLAGAAYTYHVAIQAPAAQAARQGRYQTCLTDADRAQTARWSRTCSRLAAEQPHRLTACIAQANLSPDTYSRKLDNLRCQEAYHPSASSGSSCSLPIETADRYNAVHRAAREDCLAAAKAGL